MALRHSARTALSCTLARRCSAAAAVAAYEASSTPLTIATGTVSIAGDVEHPRMDRLHDGRARDATCSWPSSVAGAAFWDEIVKPGAIEAFDMAIPAAIVVVAQGRARQEHAQGAEGLGAQDIAFRLRRLEPRPGTPGALRGIGMLEIAGVEREVALDLTTQRKDAGLTVKGQVDILMTDFGITPPKAMLGMLKTDPKVTITFETVLTVPRRNARLQIHTRQTAFIQRTRS